MGGEVVKIRPGQDLLPKEQVPTKRGRGAPRKHNRKKLLKALNEYIDSHELPIVSEFAYLNGLNRTNIYEFPELTDALKRLIAKKEHALEVGALTGKYHATMAIFSLKQIGWKDTHAHSLDPNDPPAVPVEATVLPDDYTPEQIERAYLQLTQD